MPYHEWRTVEVFATAEGHSVTHSKRSASTISRYDPPSPSSHARSSGCLLRRSRAVVRLPAPTVVSVAAPPSQVRADFDGQDYGRPGCGDGLAPFARFLAVPAGGVTRRPDASHP